MHRQAERSMKHSKTEIGIVQTQFATVADELVLESGESLGPITLAYETYGELNGERSNAVLICHALSGDAHVAGYHKGEKKPGWWHDMVGRAGPLIRTSIMSSAQMFWADARARQGRAL